MSRPWFLPGWPAIPAPGRTSSSAANSNSWSIPTAFPSSATMLKECPKHSADAALCPAGAGRAPGPGRDPRQGREPALRLRRLQGAGRRDCRLQRALRRRRRRLPLQHELRRRHERQARGDHRRDSPSPPRARATTAARSPPAPSCSATAASIFLPKFTSGREGSRDPRPRRRGDPRRRRLRHRRRRVPAQVARRTAGRSSPTPRGRATIRCRAASCAATACWRTRRSCSNGRRGRRMSSCRPASAGWPPR